MPHRPSRGVISRVALRAASRGACKRKQATADASRLSFSNIHSSSPPHPSSSSSSSGPSIRTDNNAILTSVRPLSPTLPAPSNPTDVSSLFRPRCSVYVAAFNVRTLKQAGQQAAFARTLDSLNIDVCCVSETRIQDSSTVIELNAPAVSSTFRLRTSGDAEAAAAGYAGVGVVLSERAEKCLRDWIPVNSRLCAVRLATSVKASRNRMVNRCLFIVSAYAPTDCSSDAMKDQFYDDLRGLLRLARSSDIIVVAGDLNAQVGSLSSSEAKLGGRLELRSERTDNGERLLQLCGDLGLFLCSTNFRNNKKHLATWRSPISGRPATQIDHIAVSYRWRGSITDCRSIWNTCVDSDHAIVRSRFCLRFSGSKKSYKPRIAAEKLQDSQVREQYQHLLEQNLPTEPPCDLNQHWKLLSEAIRKSALSVCGYNQKPISTHWISSNTTTLLDARKNLPDGRQYSKTRRDLNRRITRSIRADREAWWTRKAEEMEQAQKSGNARKLFQLIRATGPRKPTVSEVVKDKNGSIIFNQGERLDRWTEYFSEQFNWPSATQLHTTETAHESWDVNMAAPSFTEVKESLCALKRHRAPGPDDIPPALFKDGGEALARSLTDLLKSIWENERIPRDWGESIVVPIYKKGVRSECGNHTGISLVPVVTRLLASVILRRLTFARESLTREQQAGFRPGRGCVDHIFTLRQILEQRHVYKRPTILVFLDLKAAFDSVDRSALMSTLVQQGMPVKFVNIIRALYSQTSGRVKVYGELSKSFPTTSGVRQGCPLSPFVFNMVIDAVMIRALEGLHNPGVHFINGENIVDLEYADDIVLLFEQQAESQAFLDRLAEVVKLFGMRFAPEKCKVLLQDVDALTSPLILQGEQLDIVERFTYLGSCISSDGSVTDEVKARISKARTAFANLRHLWRQKGLPLELKGRVYRATVRAVLLYGSETWSVRAEDVRRLQVFDNRCLRTIAHVGWSQRIRNEVIRKRVLGDNFDSTIKECIERNQLRWLGHVLRMPSHRLPNKALFALPGSTWRKAKGGQPMTWQRGLKSLTKSLGSVGAVRLPGWGPRDPSSAWLETVRDMAANRSQWRSCCHFLTRSSD